MNRTLSIGANRIRICAGIEQRVDHSEMPADGRLV